MTQQPGHRHYGCVSPWKLFVACGSSQSGMSPSIRTGGGGTATFPRIRRVCSPRRVTSSAPRCRRRQLSPPPPVREDVTTHLRTGVTDPEREPAFAADIDECLPTLWRRPGSGSSYMGMGRVRGGPRHHTRGRRCGRRNSMKICTTFACGFSVSPRTSSWCGSRHLSWTVDWRPAYTCNI